MDHAPVAVSALELVVIVGDAIQVHPLPPGGAVPLGRAEDNAVRIEHDSVSRRHAVLHLDPPLRIEDLGGANGTFVRDQREALKPGETVPVRQVSKRTVPIRLGDTINLGSTTVVIRRAATGSGAYSSRDAPGVAEDAPGVIVREPKMLALYEQARRAAKTTVSILLLGETGSGKEVLAQEIHRVSNRATGPMVAFNCAALSETLLESELFGHEKGAFTGATHQKRGLFEAASGGTLFLDEVGELPLATQAKLLRVLAERKVRRVGALEPRAVDVRLLSATNRDLAAEVKQKTFREDLFYRLNTVELKIPPLRERRAEIAPLARAFLADACRCFERAQVPELAEETIGLLQRHDWPGNIRELRNVIERAVALGMGDVLGPEVLPGTLAQSAGGAVASGNRLQEAIEATERQCIVEALKQTDGNQTNAAKLLGMSRRTLIEKMVKYGLPRPRKKV